MGGGQENGGDWNGGTDPQWQGAIKDVDWFLGSNYLKLFYLLPLPPPTPPDKKHFIILSCTNLTLTFIITNKSCDGVTAKK